MCASLYIGAHLASLIKIEMVAVRNTNGPPIFWVFNSPSPASPGADAPHRGRGHVDRHSPYTNNIWCGSVHALLRYRSKTAKMQKFPIDSHSNENCICPFFRPPRAANPQKGRSDVLTQATSACELWRESAGGLLRNRWPNQKTNKKKHTVKQILRPSLGEWRVTNFLYAGYNTYAEWRCLRRRFCNWHRLAELMTFTDHKHCLNCLAGLR